MFKGIIIRLRLVAFLIVVLAIGPGSAPIAVAAQANGQTAPSGPLASTKATPPVVAAGESSDPYYSVQTITLSDGTQVDRTTINGPAKPPPGYELERAPVAASGLNRPGVASSLTVPAYNWVFGCGAVSGAMIGAYFDRNGLPDIYTGPTNGGIMPMDNSIWPKWTDSVGVTYPGNPLVASRNGSDGRTIRGSIDDYWVADGSTAPDPYLTGGWAQHAWGDAFGDYMKTSQSAYGNADGSSVLYTWTSSAAPLMCAQMVSDGIADEDATYGRKLFYEARGYSVTECYNQKTDNNGGGFSFANYKAQIDAGYPVFLMLTGHFVVGVGYADPSTVYLNDTWDYLTHSMTWGGSYSGRLLLAVGIVNPAVPTIPTPTITGLVPASATPGGPAFTLTVNGTNFANNSVVRWNGADRVTTYVSSTRLTATITAADIATTSTASITVFNPASGGRTSNAVLFPVSTQRKVYLPQTVKGLTGPQPGYWRDDLRLEFYVTSDRKYVDDFAIYITGDCGDYKITHVVPEPISGNAFTFSGPFYGSGTFSSTTAANVTAGLSNFYIDGCGFISGGPWSSTATWRYAAAAMGAPGSGAGINAAEPATGMPGLEVIRVK